MPAQFLLGLALSSYPGAAERRLEAGDWVEIRCPESARYCVRRSLDSSGAITLPDLPSTKLADLTPEAAGGWLSQILDRAGKVEDAHVVVRPIEGRQLSVSISGLVAHAETRLLSPGLTLQELVTEASPAPGADPSRVWVLPIDGAPVAVNPAGSPWVLRAGDRVGVVARAPREEVFVIGGVEAPSALPYEDGMTVAQAVSRVGGVSADGQSGAWRVAHLGGTFSTLPDTPNATGVELRPGDIVEVPVSPPLTAISVIGAVSQPSRVDFRRGVRLSDIVKAAGGLRPDADAAQIRIRSGDGVLTTPGSTNPLLKPGDWILVPTQR